MTKIKLPQPQWGTFFNDLTELNITQGQIKELQLATARAVQEACAKQAARWGFAARDIAKDIMALEFDV
jgi:hypothetical protein